MKHSENRGALQGLLFKLATDMLIESIPVFGPIYKVACLVNHMADMDKRRCVNKLI